MPVYCRVEWAVVRFMPGKNCEEVIAFLIYNYCILYYNRIHGQLMKSCPHMSAHVAVGMHGVCECSGHVCNSGAEALCKQPCRN